MTRNLGCSSNMPDVWGNPTSSNKLNFSWNGWLTQTGLEPVSAGRNRELVFLPEYWDTNMADCSPVICQISCVSREIEIAPAKRALFFKLMALQCEHVLLLSFCFLHNCHIIEIMTSRVSSTIITATSVTLSVPPTDALLLTASLSRQ